MISKILSVFLFNALTKLLDDTHETVELTETEHYEDEIRCIKMNVTCCDVLGPMESVHS